MHPSPEQSKRKLVKLWQKLLQAKFDGYQHLEIVNDPSGDWLDGDWLPLPGVLRYFNGLCRELTTGDYSQQMLEMLVNDIADAAHQVALFILSDYGETDRVFEMRDGILIPIEKLRPLIGPHLEEINQLIQQILTAAINPRVSASTTSPATNPGPPPGSTF